MIENNYTLKLVINTQFGGFSLSAAAFEYLKISEVDAHDRYYPQSISARSRPELISCVEALGSAASGPYSRLRIISIDLDDLLRITEYDGYEELSLKQVVNYT